MPDCGSKSHQISKDSVAMRLFLEILRDCLGLVGSLLTARAFFRLEKRKNQATLAKEAPAVDIDLQREFEQAGRALDNVVLAPNEIDSRLTAWGLVLISLSFGISIIITLSAYYGFFEEAVSRG
jgi:hypothetical protein